MRKPQVKGKSWQVNAGFVLRWGTTKPEELRILDTKTGNMLLLSGPIAKIVDKLKKNGSLDRTQDRGNLEPAFIKLEELGLLKKIRAPKKPSR